PSLFPSSPPPSPLSPLLFLPPPLFFLFLFSPSLSLSLFPSSSPFFFLLPFLPSSLLSSFPSSSFPLPFPLLPPFFLLLFL
ncbi:hypothetical protein, partial [Staphylococcus aureus]|uniref:hypothetical protein n=1 Tax=Staphylococcus aureus TaxID=1280 RepID=UPI001C4A714B